ncbi:MAG: hypothetical protein IJB46_08585 [Prevotella sp.]|nr:hypothetical protein [Prevotella sp.]
MGFFTKDTPAYALRQLEKINQEMRAISALIHLNYDMIDGRNRDKIKEHYNNIIRYGLKYDRIKNNLSIYDKLELEGLQMPLWNGEDGNVLNWEIYFKITLNRLHENINY